MQIASNNIFTKTSRTISAGVRNASCNRGWLQVFTHAACGIFTVSCFIGIMVATFHISVNPPRSESRCQPVGCRVICYEAPFYDEFEDDIVLAVMDAEANCHRVFLTLNDPAFTNETLPQNWLSRLRPVLYEISIIGGNLHHIQQNAFSAAFARSLGLLFLEKITIRSWTQQSLLGLSNLENIFIKQCNIIDIRESVLSAVSQTLRSITVIESGQWNPGNLTGSSQEVVFPRMATVDLSGNNFGSILEDTSFTRLRFCNSLYLTSSRITYIKPGAFDNLINLEYLNLNNNLLKHIEPGLFTGMTWNHPPKVRLNLENNLWHCNCSNNEIRRLTRRGILLVEPTCRSPRSVRGKTFSQFVALCQNTEPKQIVAVDMNLRTNNVDDGAGTTVESLTCMPEIPPNYTRSVVSPFRAHPCSVNVLNNSVSKSTSMIIDFESKIDDFFWIKPRIILKGDNFTMIEFSLSGAEGYGLIWYRNTCLNEVFCVNIVPDTIRLYNVDFNNGYTFCPVVLTSGSVENTQCIAYTSSSGNNHASVTRKLLFPLIAVSCIFFGALSLYLLIRKYPYLLKGSKRLLFVKHKGVDALVLPPKLPLRGVLSEASLNNSENLVNTLRPSFIRSGSVRSSHSYAPSYISALHPTEEQLANWRFKHTNQKFDTHYATISTISSSTPNSISSDSDHLYFSIEDISAIYGIIDPFSPNVEYDTVRVS